MENIKALDLNLLRIFDALLRTNSASQAAKLVGLSQPAISAGLSKLRWHLDDPLFVRSSKTMYPTPRAIALRSTVERIMRDIESAFLGERTFDPMFDSFSCRISVDDYIGLTMVPHWIREMSVRAPNVRMEFVFAETPAPHAALVQGDIDLAIRVTPHQGAGIFRRKLLDESFTTVVRNGHPLAQQMSLKNFVASRHILVSPYGGLSGTVDTALSEIGLTREVVAAVPHFSTAPFTLVETDLVATMPTRLAKMFCDYLPLTMLPPPLELPGFSMFLIWHERTHHDSAHGWLRETVVTSSLGFSCQSNQSR